MHQIIRLNRMAPLSQPQRFALRFSKYGKLGDRYYCEIDDMTRASTIKSLVKKGYLHSSANPMGRFWLTEMGESVRSSEQQRVDPWT